MLLRNMLGQACLVTENIDFVYQNCLEREKTMGLHPGDIKKHRDKYTKTSQNG